MAQTLQSAVDVWFAAIGTAPDYKTMHYWEGANQSEFDINFAGGYISREHVKAFIRNDTTGVSTPVAVTFLTASRVSVATPVPVGYTICIYRDTPKNAPLALFVDGAIMNAVNFDRNAKQSVFAVAELLDRFDATNSMAEEAILRASEAKAAAAQAAADAASAEAKVAIAQGAATSAEASAQNAASLAGTANSNASTALSVANGIDAKATEALSKSGQAVAIATDAESVANGIDAKATTALSQSSAAVATANTALTTANAAKTTADGVDGKATDALNKANALLAIQQSFRNRLHNPTFKVNNRATSATVTQPIASKFFTDRWVVDMAGTGSAVASVVGPMQDRTLPFQASVQLSVATGVTNIQIRQTIEAMNMSDVPVGAKVTFSAYLGSDLAGAVFSLKITGLGAADDYGNPGKVVAYSSTSFATTEALVNGSNIRRYSVTFTMTEKMRNGTVVEIGVANPVPSNKLYLSGLQLEVGDAPTLLENRPITIENDLCERYFQSVGTFLGGGVAAMWQFQTLMRIIPTVEFTPLQGSGFQSYASKRGVSFTAQPISAGYWEVKFTAHADF